MFKRKKKPELLIDTSEAYNLWDILKSKYTQADKLKLWKNYVKDSDLKLEFEMAEKALTKSITEMEHQLEKYGIKGPDKNRSAIITATNSEVINDSDIAVDYYIFLQEMIELFLRAIRTSTTNDNVRSVYHKQLKNMIGFLDTYVRLLKLKGWLCVPPMYKYVPAGVQDGLDAGEAYHLWDHLTYRYDNLYQTDVIHCFAHDVDFKAMLSLGKSVLLKQIEMLEKEVSHFGIPIPKAPTTVHVKPADISFIDDDHMYRIILIGIQGAASFHAQAYKQCSTNDRIRNIFRDLLFQELDLLDKTIKFGKLKGWLHPAPQFKLQ